MKILCTGGSGFIGTNLVDDAVRQQHEVINYDINLPRNQNHNRYWIEGDILDSRKVNNTIKNFDPDVIIHLAARTDLNGKDISDYSANIDGVMNIIQSTEFCRNLHLILFASSRLVCRIGYQPKTEDDYCPTTLYGESKMIGERLIKENAKKISCPWLIFRPTSIWGPWFGTPYKEFFMSIINGHYMHPKNHLIKKSYGYVGNTVFALNQLLKNFPVELNKKTIYMCDYEPIEVLDWAKQIASMYGVKPPREVNLILLEFLAKCGDMVRTLGYKEPIITSFRLNNIITDMIYDTNDLEKYCGPLPFTQSEGIKATLSWLRQQS